MRRLGLVLALVAGTASAQVAPLSQRVAPLAVAAPPAGVSGSGAANRFSLWSSATGLTYDDGIGFSGTGLTARIRVSGLQALDPIQTSSYVAGNDLTLAATSAVAPGMFAEAPLSAIGGTVFISGGDGAQNFGFLGDEDPPGDGGNVVLTGGGAGGLGAKAGAIVINSRFQLGVGWIQAFDDDAAARLGGLDEGDVYRTGAGGAWQLRVVGNSEIPPSDASELPELPPDEDEPPLPREGRYYLNRVFSQGVQYTEWWHMGNMVFEGGETPGLVPAAAQEGDHAKFLRGDGTWAEAGGGSAPTVTPASFTGTGSATDFTVSGTIAGIVAVTVNGLVTSAYTVNGSTVEFASAPALNDAILVLYFAGAMPSTLAAGFDSFDPEDVLNGARFVTGIFPLSHAPSAGGVLLVSDGGVVQAPTRWALVNSDEIHFTAPPTGWVVITYLYPSGS